MAVTAAEIQVIVEAEVNKAIRDLNNFDKALGNAGKTATQTGRAVKRAGTDAKRASNDWKTLAKQVGLFAGGAALAARALRGTVRFLQESSQAAAEAEETWAKFDAVFKENADTVREWANEFAESFGRSSTEVAQFASTLQDTFVPLGFARDAAADLSQQVTALAFDLASFNNLRTQDVVRDLQSALVGNTETVRKYGVVLSQAAIQQEALSSGLVETAGEIDALTKAQASLNIILAGTTDAQGDLARTLDSTANVARSFESQIRRSQEIVGSFVNQQLEPFRAKLAEILTLLNDNAEETSTLAEAWDQVGTNATQANLLLTLTDELEKAQQDYNNALQESLTFLDPAEAERANKPLKDRVTQLQNQIAAINQTTIALGRQAEVEKALADQQARREQEASEASAAQLAAQQALTKAAQELERTYEAELARLSVLFSQGLIDEEELKKGGASAGRSFLDGLIGIGITGVGRLPFDDIFNDVADRIKNLEFAPDLDGINQGANFWISELERVEQAHDAFWEKQEEERQRQLEEIERIQEAWVSGFGVVEQALGAFSNIATALADRRIAEIEQERDARIAAAEQTGESIEAINEEFNDKISEERKKAARQEKALAIASSIIQTARAIVEALPNIPLSIAVGGIGAAQTAAIAAQPLPAATGTPPGGYVVPPGFENDNFPVAASSGETVTVEREGQDNGQTLYASISINGTEFGEVMTQVFRERKAFVPVEVVAS